MSERTLTFGRYRLEPQGGLMSGARNVHLTPKALALLSYIADRPGEVVTKDQLFSAVWPEVNVGDAALVTCIQELRRALKDDARRPRYIETVHRRGYRFVGKMAEARLPAAVRAGWRRYASALPLPNRPSIAVLPFANMSEDPDQEYFADGISEDLITDLSRIRWLFVIARNSTFVYKNRAVDVKQVARDLGVRYVLEGSVRRAGNRIRINAQLSMRSRVAIIGRNAMTANSATSLPCRTRLPAMWLQRSNPGCWRRRGFARSRDRRTTSAPGNWWRAPKTMCGG